MNEKLDALASKLDRSWSYVATQAISDFIARESWQLAEIDAGVEEAQRGDLSSDAEVAIVLAKYQVKPSAL